MLGVQDEFADPAGQRPTQDDGAGSSDDDRQPDDAGANGTLGDAGERREIPERVTGSPRELLDVDPSRGKRAKRPRPKPPEPPR